MVAFGTIDTDALPRFGQAVKTCYHIFLVFLYVPSNSDGSWDVSHNVDLRAFGIRGFSGNIHKSCRCMTLSEMLKIKLALRAAGVGSGISATLAKGGGTMYMGYEVENRGKCPPLDCKCTQNIDLGGLSSGDGHWTSSAGELRQFPSSNFDDVIQDIINTERMLPCDCS